MRMKAPRAQGKKPKNSTTQGAGGVPQIFFHPKSYFFVTITSVQNFKLVAHPLLGEKFVWWVVVCKPILVFRFGPKALDLDLDQAEQ